MGRKLDWVVIMVQTSVRRVIRTSKMIDSEEDSEDTKSKRGQGGGDVTRTSWVILIREPEVPSAPIGSQMAGMSGRGKGLMRPPAPVNLAENLPWPPVGGFIGPNILGLVVGGTPFIPWPLLTTNSALTNAHMMETLVRGVRLPQDVEYIEKMLFGDAHTSLFTLLVMAIRWYLLGRAADFDFSSCEALRAGTGVDEAADKVPDLHDFIPPLPNDIQEISALEPVDHPPLESQTK
ncbi:hypothetical protein NE237_012479 [Protea cynaroides]|uniref:Uncharacterized protein n=1 Tax=Protea cynaroides TaxID=273540 RepID=A0A9Q0JXN4_9MAGN|nr:hypothetical protein NE237_012479 [Protea cynaroides]